MQPYKAILFDLLTALLDSWTLWNTIAGSEAKGMQWRKAYLNRTYTCGAYRPYTTLVTEAAADAGLPITKAEELENNWLQLKPWPEVNDVLQQLSTKVKLGVVTNCSEVMGIAAAKIIKVPFDIIVTSERAGFYKPLPQPYELALKELNVTAEETLFVAGSAFDLFGTSKLGMDTYWHDRIGMTPPENMPQPLRHEKNLLPLLDMFV
jgi:2-haloacid dehalogenase